MCLSASFLNVCTVDSITVRKLERSVYFERKNIKNFLLMKIWLHLLEREINLMGRPRTCAKDHAGNFSDRKQTNMFSNWKWRNDRRSERNLCNWVKKPEKNSGLQRGLNPWPRDTGAMLCQLSYEVIDVESRSHCPQEVQFMLVREL